MRIAFVTSIHSDFDWRVWKFAAMIARRQHTVRLVCPWRVNDGAVREGLTLHNFPRRGLRPALPFVVPCHHARRLSPLLPSVDLMNFHESAIPSTPLLLGSFARCSRGLRA